MNTAPVIEAPTTQEQAPPRTERSIIAARIREATMQQSTKKLAVKLLEGNLLVGDTFHITLSVLRHVCHAANNLEASKHLRKMRKVGLLTYNIDHKSGQVALKFVV